MFLIRRFLSILIIAVVAGHASLARAQGTVDAPVNTPIAVIEFISDGFLNMRSSADANSNIIKKLIAGQSGFSATGRTAVNGATPWIEISDGIDTGWVNSRFVRRADSLTPLSSPNPAMVMERKHNREFEGRGYSENAVRSFSECERLCLAADRCAAVEFHRNTNSCNLFERELKIIAARNIDVGIKKSGNEKQGVTGASPHSLNPANRQKQNSGASALKRIKQDVCDGTIREFVSGLSTDGQVHVREALRDTCGRCFSEGLTSRFSGEQLIALDAGLAGKIDADIAPEATRAANEKYDQLFAECSSQIVRTLDRGGAKR